MKSHLRVILRWSLAWSALGAPIAIAPALAGAAEPAASASLEQLVRAAWESSPALRAQETQADLASGDRWRRFIPNEPQFAFTSADNASQYSFGLQLNVALPFKTLAYTGVDAARARSQQAELAARKYEVARAVTQAYLDCAAAQAALELQRVTSDDLNTVFHSLKASYETGHAAQAEKIGGELQARQAELDLETAEDRRATTCERLRGLLAVTGVTAAETDPGAPAATHPLPDDLDGALVTELADLTADQARARAASDVAAANSATAWWSQVPDLTLGAQRNHYVFLPASPSGAEWTTNYQVAVTVPLGFPFHETVEARRARSQAALDRDAADLQRAAADSDQADGAREYRRSRRRLHELRARDLPLGEALAESTSSAYRAGKLGFAELMLSRKTLNDLRAQDIQLRTSIINAHLRCLSRCRDAGPEKESRP